MSAVEVACTEHGPADAPVVVLSGSLGATRAMWDPQLPALAEQFRVLAYDSRGHGDSPAPAGPYALDDLVDDVLALLDRAGAERAHLVGLSLGGMVAMRLAARAPDRIDRLVLMCTSAKPDPQGFLDRAATVRATGTAAVADTVVSRWLTPPFAAVHPALVAELAAMIAAADDEGYAACCEVVAAVDLRDDLARITAPTLVLAAAEDLALPPAHQELIAAGIPGAELRTLDPAAHLANLERAPEVTAALLAHLTGGAP